MLGYEVLAQQNDAGLLKPLLEQVKQSLGQPLQVLLTDGSYTGGADPHYPSNTLYGEFFKSIGVTNVAGLAYGSSPSSTASIKDLKVSVEHAGLKMICWVVVPRRPPNSGSHVMRAKPASNFSACQRRARSR